MSECSLFRLKIMQNRNIFVTVLTIIVSAGIVCQIATSPDAGVTGFSCALRHPVARQALTNSGVYAQTCRFPHIFKATPQIQGMVLVNEENY
jgi:hypothetical protein